MQNPTAPVLSSLPKNLQELNAAWADLISLLETRPDLPLKCALFQALCTQYDELDSYRKAMYALTERLEGVVIKQFEDQGIDKVAIPELERSFYPLQKYSATVLNKEEGYKWLRENNAGALITETVNAQTLAAFLKARLIEEGKDPPESMKLEPYKIVGSSKYKPKPDGKRR